MNVPFGITLDSANALYITDTANNRIQKYVANVFNESTVAGQANGFMGSAANDLSRPGYVSVDSNKNMYVSDSYNHRIQRGSSSAVSGVTIAGNGKKIDYRMSVFSQLIPLQKFSLSFQAYLAVV